MTTTLSTKAVEAVVRQCNHEGRRCYSVDRPGHEILKGLVSVTRCISGVLAKGFPYEAWIAKTNREAIRDAAISAYHTAIHGDSGVYPESDFLLQLDVAAKDKRADIKAMRKAGDIGTKVHKRIERYLQGAAVPIEEPSQLEATAFTSWLEWHGQNNLQSWHLEKPVYSTDHMYAGTVDCYGLLNGQKAVIDWKTGSGIYEEAVLQNAAYCLACEESGLPRPDVGVIVHCPKTEGNDFDVRVIERDEMQANIEAFLAVLKVWNWKEGR